MMDEQLLASKPYSSYSAQLRELGVPGMRNRLGSAFLMMSTYSDEFTCCAFSNQSSILVFQNLTGVNAINYYSPRIFQSIGIIGTNAGLFGTGIYGIVKLIVTLLWSIFLIDNVGRKRLLIFGSAGAICTCLFCSVYRACQSYVELISDFWVLPQSLSSILGPISRSAPMVELSL